MDRATISLDIIEREEKTMKYVVKKVGQDAVAVESKEEKLTLEELQNGVGGCIEAVYVGEYIIYCNDEGKIIGLPPNVAIMYDDEAFDTLQGDLLITKNGHNGYDADMTDDDVETVLNMFNKPMYESLVRDAYGTFIDFVPVIDRRKGVQ